jgi:hydrogenase maturation protease
MKKVLILGIGNWLMGDEGVGVHFAQMMEKENLPPGVDVLDGGTGGFHLAPYFDEYPVIVMIDATLDNKNPPGTIRLIEPKFSIDFPKAMSTHDIGLKDLIDSMTLVGNLPKIFLFVVTIKSLQLQQITLSKKIESILPALKDKVFRLLSSI